MNADTQVRGRANAGGSARPTVAGGTTIALVSGDCDFRERIDDNNMVETGSRGGRPHGTVTRQGAVWSSRRGRLVRMQPSTEEFTRHVAFEVHWLVYAAVRFLEAGGRDQVAFQDSACIHARNLLELTGPSRSTNAWWVVDLGGISKQADVAWRGWTGLINEKIVHLGKGRIKGTPRRWPVPEDDERCVAMARFVLERLLDSTRGGTDPRTVSAFHIAQLGLDYLSIRSQAALKLIADLVD